MRPQIFSYAATLSITVSQPEEAVEQMWRLTKRDGLFFVSVDIGGEPTPDEPTVFTEEGLFSLIQRRFDLIADPVRRDPHSAQRDLNITLLARKKGEDPKKLDKRAVLAAYQDRVEERYGPGSVVRGPALRAAESAPEGH